MKHIGNKAVKRILCGIAPLVAGGGTFVQAADGDLSAARPLALREAVRKVLDYNETIQIRALEVAISNRRVGAERSIFEPEFVASAEHVDSHRPNTEEQRRALSLLTTGKTVFDERNNNYSAGVEFLSPAGGKFRVGSQLRDLSNNLNTTLGNEYSTTVGVSLTQPLLKGAGVGVTMANIRIASISSDVAFQDYRKKLMEIVATAEAAYWDLYLTQEQYRLTTESVKLAETILKDNKEREKAGKGSQLEVLESESGLAVRKSKQSEAMQKMYEAINRLSALYSTTVVESKELIKAADRPEVYDAPESFYESWRQAFELNPDYLTRRKQATLEGVRVAYQKNQRLPQLDLKASYGLNGLGFSPESSLNDINNRSYQAWTLSGEMRIPLGGGMKSKHELAAARLREKQALLGIRDVEVQISNALDSSIRKLKSSKDGVKSYESVVEFSQQVLQTQLARLEVGKTDSRTVLETEQKVFEARLSVLDGLVQHQRAKLEWENIEGSILTRRHLEMTKEQIGEKTRQLGGAGKLSDAEYQNFLRDVRESYDRKTGEKYEPASTPATPSTPKKTLNENEQDKLLEILRNKINETK